MKLHSQTLPLKIFETKKRLSNPIIQDSSLWAIALCGLLVILVYASKPMTLGAKWGVVAFDIPVVSSPVRDPGLHTFTESPGHVIGSNTLVIGLTPSELIFGDLKSFTSARSDVRNKFIVNHIEGSPQIRTLLAQLDEWTADRKRRLGVRDDGLVILLPDPNVPMAVVTAVVQSLRASNRFTHVTVGGGVL